MSASRRLTAACSMFSEYGLCPHSLPLAGARSMLALTHLVYALLPVLPFSLAAAPGTFFWKPRVALDIAAVPTVYARTVNKPTWKNIADGYVVLIDGYQAGLTVASLSTWLQDVHDSYPHLHPGRAHYYTNMYRWAWRHLSLIPEWFGAKKANYVRTHQVWRKRFFYMNYMVPQWMRNILFFVKDESWKREDWEMQKFERHAEAHFGKYYHYPSKKFNNWNSNRNEMTVEGIDITDNSIYKPREHEKAPPFNINKGELNFG